MANKLPSIIQAGNNQYPTPAISLNRFATDIVNPGIIGAFTNTAGIAPTTGAMAVNAQGSPNMTVAVTGGVAYVSATPAGGTAQTLGVTADVSENVTINANASGSTVYDFLYLSLDPNKLNNPASNGLDVCTYVTSRSTTAYSASGANNGNSNGAQTNCLLLAVVTVVNGAASIANASITDARANATSLLTGASNTLGYAQITNPFTTTNTTATQITSLTATVTVPGNRKVKITAFCDQLYNSTATQASTLSIWDGVVGSGTQLASCRGFAYNPGAVTGTSVGIAVAVVTPTAGSKTYNVGLHGNAAGTSNCDAGANTPAFILVELI